MTPNLKDPRVRRRCENVLVWLDNYFKKESVRSISRSILDRHFGQQQNPLSHWLRGQLLTVESHRYSRDQHICKQYSVRREGVNSLKQLLGVNTEQLHKQKLTELLSKPIEYTVSSDRLFHPIQQFSKDRRNPIMAQQGYQHDYDIRCCSATVLLQLAQQRGCSRSLEHLSEYVRDRSKIRLQLQQDLALDAATVKELLTGIIMGAKVGAYHENTLFALVKYNHTKMTEIKQHPWITGLRLDLKYLWQAIKRHEPQSVKLTSRNKNAIYRREEMRVGQVIRKYLKKNKNDFVWMHDGWMSQAAVNVMELSDLIRQQTGYQLEFEYCCYGDIC